MAVGVKLASSGPLLCNGCKIPNVDLGRGLCPSCLTRSLQRACKNSASLSPGTSPIGRVSPRAFFPGMPRAVLSTADGGPSKIVDRRRTMKNDLQQLVAKPGEKITLHADDKAAASELSSKIACPPVSTVVRSCKVGKANEDDVHGNVSGNICPNFPNLRYEECSGKIRNIDTALPRREDGKPGLEKWRLFQLQKRLTVRIPNPASDMSNFHLPQLQKPLTVKIPKPGSDLPNHHRLQPVALVQTKGNQHKAQPLQKRALPKNSRQIRPRKWTIAPDADAEADLMMRLLADTRPVLKSTAPLILPTCKIKPPPSLSPSPPGDPLWKRRCIPCPKTLQLHTSSICVR